MRTRRLADRSFRCGRMNPVSNLLPGRGGWLRTVFLAALLSAFLFPTDVRSQDPSPPPLVETESDDTYSSAEVEALIGRARAAKSRIAEGLSAYEARMWERVRVGVVGSDFRRERTVFEQERRARIRWSAEDEHQLLWQMARREFPIAGVSSQTDERTATSLRDDLLIGRNSLPAPLLYDPGSDQIAFGRVRFLSPLADSAAAHYRYSSDGRTVRLGLGEGGGIVLQEVRVEPRRSDPRLISASLWFEVSTGSLVRSSYRPARPFDLAVDSGTEERENGPGAFEGAFLVEVSYVTIDHGFYDQQWWIPRRFAFEGVVRLAALAELPVEVEWTLDDVWTNDEGDLLAYLTSLGANLPADWTMRLAARGIAGPVDSVRIFLPPAAELAAGVDPAPNEPVDRPLEDVFSPEEIAELERVLGEVEGSSGLLGTLRDPRLRTDHVTFNRVEGFSLGVGGSRPIGTRTEVALDLRYGLSDEELGGTLALSRRITADRTLRFSLFRRVDSSSEWSGGRGIVSSLETLLFGREHTPFHRAWGADLSLADESSPIRTEVRLFLERHASVSRTTNTHLARLWSEDLLPLNPASSEGRWAGASVDARWSAGTDPREARSFGRVHVEGAGGSSRYLRGWTSAGVAVPLGEHWGSAIEAGIGASGGELPQQRRFAPGGPRIFRGLNSGEVFGEAFWFGRIEVGRGLPVARVILFFDALEIAPASTLPSFRESQPEAAVGIGLSVLDGLFRLDIARELPNEGRGGWKVFLYRDGLF